MQQDIDDEQSCKNVTKLLKNHILKIGRVRNELLSVPFKVYMDEVDLMIKAVVSAQAFLKEAAIYQKKYNNLGQVHIAGEDMFEWLDSIGARVVKSLAVAKLVFQARVHNHFATMDGASKAVECIVAAETDMFFDRVRASGQSAVDLLDVLLLDGFRAMCEVFGDEFDSQAVCTRLTADLEPLNAFLDRL